MQMQFGTTPALQPFSQSRAVGMFKNPGRGLTYKSMAYSTPQPPLCVEMGFYVDISWESRCNIEINVWAHFDINLVTFCGTSRVSVQGVKSLGGHFACLCRGFEIYEVKKKIFVVIFQKENWNTFTLFIIFIVKSLQKEQNSTNLLLWPSICRNKSAITPKWFNSLDTNSRWSPSARTA